METELLNVSGMTCGGCTAKVSKALKAVNGVKDVQVSLADGAATVQFDGQLTSSMQLKLAVQEAGYVVAAGHAHSPAAKGGCCA